MTGYAATELALLLLGYTTPQGETDPLQNGEQWRMAVPALQMVLADILHVTRQSASLPETLTEELPVADDVARRAVVPGLAMQLALCCGDGDGYNRFALAYAQQRSGLPKGKRQVTDTAPLPVY